MCLKLFYFMHKTNLQSVNHTQFEFLCNVKTTQYNITLLSLSINENTVKILSDKHEE